jgi:site-specific DNA recombinase
MFCGICQRRMHGSWHHGKPYYRCVHPVEPRPAGERHHPRGIYIREEVIVPNLDRWLLGAFCPTALPHTIQALADAQKEDADEELLASTAETRRTIADCDQRITTYRAALEAGTDPALIAQWTAEVNATRAAAQADLRSANQGKTAHWTPAQINAIVTALGSILAVLQDADPADKAKIYSGVGLLLTYQPDQNTVIAEAKPPAIIGRDNPAVLSCDPGARE